MRFKQRRHPGRWSCSRWSRCRYTQCYRHDLSGRVDQTFDSVSSAPRLGSRLPIFTDLLRYPAFIISGRIVAIQQLSIMSGIFLQYFVQLGASYIDVSSLSSNLLVLWLNDLLI